MTAANYEVKDWVENTKCVPTTLAAVTGRPISKVMEAINAEAKEQSCKKNMLEIIEASADQMSSARELFLEYASTLEFDLGFQGFKEEVLSLPGDYSPPNGCILFAYQDSELAGCVALRPFAKSISEMKRLYVRHKFQGRGIGRALATAVLRKASVLDYPIRYTVPSMKAAIQMYRSMGFYPIPPCRQNPIPGTSYLEKDLTVK